MLVLETVDIFHLYKLRTLHNQFGFKYKCEEIAGNHLINGKQTLIQRVPFTFKKTKTNCDFLFAACRENENHPLRMLLLKEENQLLIHNQLNFLTKIELEKVDKLSLLDFNNFFVEFEEKIPVSEIFTPQYTQIHPFRGKELIDKYFPPERLC